MWAAVLPQLATPAATMFGGYALAAIVNRRAANKQADAASRTATTADWKGYVESVHWRLKNVEDRLEASEKRADSAEDLLRVALRHIRELVAWGVGPRTGPMPEPPPELLARL